MARLVHSTAAIALALLSACSLPERATGDETAKLERTSAMRPFELRADGVLLRNISPDRKFYALETTDFFSRADYTLCSQESTRCRMLASGDSAFFPDLPHWTKGTEMTAMFHSVRFDWRGKPYTDPDDFIYVRFPR